MLSAYVFEAKSVQAYILAGDRLRDIVGGSALLDWLTSIDHENAPLGSLKRKFDIAAFPRAAGGAVTAVFENDKDGLKAREFRAVWRFRVGHSAPGLTFSDGVGGGENSQQAISEAQKKARFGSNIRQVELPQAIPLMAQSQRMSAPAAFVEGQIKANGLCKITNERTDYSTLAKRYFRKDLLGARLGTGNVQYVWPNEFDPDRCPEGSVVFPFGDSDEREIAIIHADGDGIGAKIMAAMANAEDAGAEIKSISQNLTLATTNAAIAATKAVLLPKADKNILAARPVLLGGDDMTMIVRADLALDFLTHYCREFSAQTKDCFANLPDGHPFCGGVTASGAAVFIKARQPFSKALKLTEALTKHAKGKGDGHISFFRCTTSKIPTDVEDAWPSEGLTFGPYDACGFDRLRRLAEVLENEAIGRSGLRLILDAKGELSWAAFDRSCKIMDARAGGTEVTPSTQLKNALADLGAEMPVEPETLEVETVKPETVKAALRDAFMLHRLRVNVESHSGEKC